MVIPLLDFECELVLKTELKVHVMEHFSCLLIFWKKIVSAHVSTVLLKAEASENFENMRSFC